MNESVVCRAARRLISTVVLLPLLLLSSAGVFAQQTFVVTADSYTKDTKPTTNYGNTSTMQIQSSGDRTAYMQFDLSSIVGSTATSAFLEVGVFDVGNPPTSEVRKILASWNESTITHNNRPSLGPVSTTFSATNADEGNVISIDVTSVVNELLATPASDFGIALSPSAGKLHIDSSEGGPAPQLVITTGGGGSNTAPTADAGSDASGTVNIALTLDGEITDDGLPNPPASVTSTWSLVSGPGLVTFGDENLLDSTATFDTAGSYVLRLTADDSVLTDTDDVTITVSNQSASQTFTVVGDTYTKSTQATTNYGTSSLLNIQSSGTRTTFLQFDLSSFPSGATASSAQLEMSVNDVGNPPTVTVHKILTSWTETGVTHNTQPTLGATSTTFTATNADEGTVISVDITSLFNALLADPPNDFGIALFPDAGKLYLDSLESGSPIQIVATPSGSGSNTPPVAQNDTFTVAEDSTSNPLAVLQDNGSGADSDADLDTLSVSSVVSPGSQGGVITIDGAGTGLLYTPPSSFTGIETFDYTLSDGQGGFDTATVSVTVSAGSTPDVPTGLTGPSSSTSGNYTISWNSSAGSVTYTLEEQLGSTGWTEIHSDSATSKAVSNGASGTYMYRVKGCDASSVCSNWSASHTVNVSIVTGSPATPPSPAPFIDPGAGQTDSIGTTAGNFRVDESGAATYRIPIAAPAGTAGVAPDISLFYSSSAGNGVAGMGWSIGGLSNISRCRQTYDQDKNVTAINWTSSDRFCLDGQRLVMDPAGQTYGATNTTYRTEIDSGTIVTIIGNVNGEPDYFEVKRKDGSTSHYGSTPFDADNSAKLQGGNDFTLSWGVRRFADSVGNPIWFQYISSAGERRIDSIRYAYGLNNGPNSGYAAEIEFTYQTRSDWLSGYVAGELFEDDLLLASITSTNNGSVVRKYNLGYQSSSEVTNDDLSRLDEVEECVSFTCLPATTFGWRTTENFPSINVAANHSMGGSTVALTPADINGDGLMDIAWLQGSGAQKTLRYALSNGDDYIDTTFTDGNFGRSVTSIATNPKLKTIDYNLDGRQDIIYWDGTASRWQVILSEPSGTGWKLDTQIHTTPPMAFDATFVDIDSDGSTDAIYKVNTLPSQLLVNRLVQDPSDPSPSSSSWYAFGSAEIVSSSNPDHIIGTISSAGGDFNGDGRVDIVVSGSEIQCDEETGTNCVTVENRRALAVSGAATSAPSVASYQSFPTETVNYGGQNQTHYPQLDRLVVADVNADGLSDVLYPLGPFGTTLVSEYRLRINDGTNLFLSIPITDANIELDGSDPQMVDWNMDGYLDLMYRDVTGSGSVRVRLWNPATNGLDASELVSIAPSTSTTESVSYFDFNGDATTDIVRFNAGGVVGDVQVLTREVGASPTNIAVNKIESIINGLGAETRINYESLSTSENYVRLQIATSPGSQTVCIDTGHPTEDVCFVEPIIVPDIGAFYQALNGDWGSDATPHNLGKNSPILELSGSSYVTTKVTVDSPTAGANPGNINTGTTSSRTYHYGEAKAQAAGRGFLGFQRMTVVDDQTGTVTSTRYRQDWPFIGRPISTEVRTNVDQRLQHTEHDWEVVNWSASMPATAASNGTASLGNLFVRETQRTEESRDLAQGTELRTVTTTTNFEPTEANALEIDIVTTVGSTQVKSVETTNTFDTTNFTWFDGRLNSTTVVSTTPNKPSITRLSSFDYHTSSPHVGLLKTETIEPNNPGPSDVKLVTTHSYDNYGNRDRSAINGSGETRCDVDTVIYDSTGRYVDTTFDCLGRKASEVVGPRNAFGAPLQIDTFVDTNGQDAVRTDIRYSTLGREYYRYSNSGVSTTQVLTSNVINCPASTTFKAQYSDATGALTEVCNDVLGREVRTLTRAFDGTWNAQDTEYDAIGRVQNVSEPYALGSSVPWNELDYDLVNRVTRVDLADGTVQTAIYDGHTTTFVNDEGQQRKEIRNAVGEIVGAADNLQRQTDFEYDAQGFLLTMTDADGNATSAVPDLLGRNIQLTDPDKGTWDYSYNAFGELVVQVDAKFQVQIMCYDGLGRISKRYDFNSVTCSASNPTATWSYDTAPSGLGQVDTEQDNSSGFTRVYSYDTFGRPSVTDTTIDGVTYSEQLTYDEFSRLFQSFDAAGNGLFNDFGVVYEYNNNGYLQSISDAVEISGNPRTVYRQITAMNARNQITTETIGDAVIQRVHDFEVETGLLKTIDTTSLATTLTVQDLDYIWDDIGNLQSRTDLGLTESFMYGSDGMNRLTDYTVGSQSTISVLYAPNGNIDSKSDIGSYSYSGSGNAGPHAVTSAGGSTYFYDENGNNTAGGGRTIDYTVFDKPSEISKGSHTTQFSYDPYRSRYKRIDAGSGGTTTTRYVGNVEIIDLPNGTQERKRYLAGVALETVTFNGGNEVSRSTQYVFRDHLGSIDAISNSGGTIVDQDFSFDPWGQRRDASDGSALTESERTNFNHDNTTAGYTGHEMLDEVGIIHMNGRIFDPTLARFVQADPFVPEPMNTQSLNRFSYVNNNPLNATDPSGYEGLSLLISAFIFNSSVATAIAHVTEPEVNPIPFGLGTIPGVAQNALGHTPSANESESNAMFEKLHSAHVGPTATIAVRDHHSVMTAGRNTGAGSSEAFRSAHSTTGSGTPRIANASHVDPTAISRAARVAGLARSAQLAIDDLTFDGGFLAFYLGRVVQDFVLAPVVDTASAIDSKDVGGVLLASGGAIFKPLRAARVVDDAGDLGRSAISTRNRANEIHGALGTVTQRKTTTAVTETAEGVRVVSSSERRLRPAQRRLLRDGEIEGVGSGHAEITGINAARSAGLNPTGTAASRPICQSCAKTLSEQGIEALSPLKK